MAIVVAIVLALVVAPNATSAQAASSHYYVLKNRAYPSPALCLDADHLAKGALVHIKFCTANSNYQHWLFSSYDSWAVWRLAASPTLCLDADANHLGNGAKVQIWTCHGGKNQQWFWSAETGVVTNTAYGCLDADANWGGDGAKVQLWRCNDEGQQSWSAVLH